MLAWLAVWIGKAASIMSNIFLGTALLELAERAAGCNYGDDDGALDDLAAEVWHCTLGACAAAGVPPCGVAAWRSAPPCAIRHDLVARAR